MYEELMLALSFTNSDVLSLKSIRSSCWGLSFRLPLESLSSLSSKEVWVDDGERVSQRVWCPGSDRRTRTIGVSVERVEKQKESERQSSK